MCVTYAWLHEDRKPMLMKAHEVKRPHHVRPDSGHESVHGMHFLHPPTTSSGRQLAQFLSAHFFIFT
jgi:hypothetical protein